MNNVRHNGKTSSQQRNTKKRKKAYWFGMMAEWRVILYLKLRGHRILKQRYKTKAGEIDIITLRRGRIHCIEVKARQHQALNDVLSHKQQQRIIRASAIFISRTRRYANQPLQFDLAIVQSGFRLRYIAAAWSA